MGKIHTAYNQGIDRGFDYRPGSQLYVSDLGYHPRRAMERVKLGTRATFDPATLQKMRAGVALEKDTLDTVGLVLGGALRNVPIFDQIWSGEMDLLLGHDTGHPQIVEHKYTGDRWWDSYTPVKTFHICQLWLYGWLYSKRFGVDPALILYYRAHGHYLEAQVERVDPYPHGAPYMQVNGEKDGAPYMGQYGIDPNVLRVELEEYYTANDLPPAPLGGGKYYDYASDRCAGLYPVASN